MKYDEFIKSKMTKAVDSGFEISIDDLNPMLFDWQKEIVRWSLAKGKSAIFADCGLGKTAMQLEWAHQVSIHTGKPVLILAPLAVSGQTIGEGIKFNIPITHAVNGSLEPIQITNYEQIGNIVPRDYVGVVLDESSILKNYTGMYKKTIIEVFSDCPYKLACTATPSPNDINEIGNHSEFLDVMDSADMRMRWFVRDEGMNNYRLKGHAKSDFYHWVASWSKVLRSPSDMGYDGSDFVLPKLEYVEIQVETDQVDEELIFNDLAVSATQFNGELRRTKKERIQKVIDIILSHDQNDSVIVWVNQNEEADLLIKALTENSIDGFREVRGSDSNTKKEKDLLDFACGKFRILITKGKIAGMGMNFQICNIQIFASLDFSFEKLYQSIRRSYRFGQKKSVIAYLITTDTMTNVLDSIKRKQDQFDELVTEIVNATSDKRHYEIVSDYDKFERKTDHYHVYRGDSVEIIDNIPDNSVHFSVFSPPFSTLFTYSDNIRDLGNCESHEQFMEQNQYLLDKLYKKIAPGRLVAVHSKDLARYKNSSGYSGLFDFTGDYHRAMEKAGFKYHSKITIWTDPVLEMQRTKTQRLLYKQVTTDSSYTGIGLPEYVTIFRKWEGNEDDWIPITHINKQNFDLDTWQAWASPIWMDIRRTDVLSDWRGAKDVNDEKHICPLQIGVIERLIHLWSNPGETVFTPFMGIGSEVYQSIKQGRYGIGIELKESYYNQAVKNCENAVESLKETSIFDIIGDSQ